MNPENRSTSEFSCREFVIRASTTVLVLVGMMLVIVPWAPILLGGGLDGSYSMAMNQALAQGLVFGRDIVFTVGPYASIYTRFYHPFTDHLMLVSGLLLAVAAGAGVVVLAGRRNAIYALLSPLVFVVVDARDAILLCLPIIFLFLVARIALPALHPRRIAMTPAIVLTLILLFAMLGLLPLIKGTLAMLALLLAGAGFLLLARDHAKFAWSLLSVVPVAMLVFWILAEQPARALPQYFLSQLPIIGGYSEAMGIFGRGSDLAIYWLCAFMVSIAFYLRLSRGSGFAGAVSMSAVLLALFCIFKASFVRHDNHVIVASGSLLLVGWLLALQLRGRQGLIVLLACTLGGIAIERGLAHRSLSERATAATAEVGANIGGFFSRIREPARLAGDYAARIRYIAGILKLPILQGSVDVYSTNQILVLASGLQWAPRPVFQSYAAYTPALAQLNANHLAGSDAPQNIVFQIEPIDGRLPALEDGLSWPLLLSRYTLGDRTEYGAIMTRRSDAPSTSNPLGDVIRETIETPGAPIGIPAGDEMLWTQIDFEQTVPGQFMNFLFKPAEVQIALTFADGRIRKFRYLPTLGSAGFLLSPLVENTDDFIALASSQRERLAAKRPISMALTVKRGGDWQWQKQFTVRWRRFDPPIRPDIPVFADADQGTR